MATNTDDIILEAIEMDISEKLVTIANNAPNVCDVLNNSKALSINNNVVQLNNVCNIEHPVNIKLTSGTITDFSDITVTACGKNLIPSLRTDASTTTYTGITTTNNPDGSITVNGTAEYSYYYWFTGPNAILLQPGTYTFNAGFSGGSTPTYYIGFKYGDKEVYYYNGTPCTFTITESTLCGSCLCVIKGTTVNNLTVYPQLEIGTVATIYEPGETIQSVKASTDGIVKGIRSVSPNMCIMADSEVTIHSSYFLQSKVNIVKNYKTLTDAMKNAKRIIR